MKRVIITGASGMIGSIIVRHCLASESVEEVLSIVRKPSETSHPKLKEIVVNDFLNYTVAKGRFVNYDIAYFCIGVYTGAVADNEFKTITVNYTKAFADILKQESPNATMCFLSGAGADRTEKSKVSFAKYKGIAENYLISKAFNQLYIFRPGYIYPVTKRKEPNISYQLFRVLYPALKIFLARFSITSEELGKVMFNIGLNGASENTLENIDIRNCRNVY